MNHIFRHKWGKWKDKEDGEILRREDIIGAYIIQERRCEQCNKVGLRGVKIEVIKK